MWYWLWAHSRFPHFGFRPTFWFQAHFEHLCTVAVEISSRPVGVVLWPVAHVTLNMHGSMFHIFESEENVPALPATAEQSFRLYFCFCYSVHCLLPVIDPDCPWLCLIVACPQHLPVSGFHLCLLPLYFVDLWLIWPCFCCIGTTLTTLLDLGPVSPTPGSCFLSETCHGVCTPLPLVQLFALPFTFSASKGCGQEAQRGASSANWIFYQLHEAGDQFEAT